MTLSSLLLAAAIAAAPFPPPGTYKYAASLSGQNIGVWSVSVKPDGADTELDEKSSASLAGMSVSATATLLLGPDLAPVRYDGNYRTAGQSPSVTVSLTPSSAMVVGSASASPRALSLAANTRHFVVIEPLLVAGLFALPAQLASWKEQAVTWIAPMTAEAQAVGAAPAPAQARPPGVPAQDVGLAASGPIPVTMWYDPATLVPDLIAVPSQNAVLTRMR